MSVKTTCRQVLMDPLDEREIAFRNRDPSASEQSITDDGVPVNNGANLTVFQKVSLIFGKICLGTGLGGGKGAVIGYIYGYGVGYGINVLLEKSPLQAHDPELPNSMGMVGLYTCIATQSILSFGRSCLYASEEKMSLRQFLIRTVV